MKIQFHTEAPLKFRLKGKLRLRAWIKQVIKDHQKVLGPINYIFCTDEALKTINQSYLNHDYFTDIITFDLSSDEKLIEGDIYISIDRVKDNAVKLDQAFEVELRRVIIHGILHLIGFKDKSSIQKKKMRQAENQMLLLYQAMNI